jgi:hypothetical protein
MKRESLKKASFGMLGIAGACVAGLGLVPAALAASPGSSATPAASVRQWHVVKSVNEGPDAQLTAVVATGPTSGWAFESSTTGRPVAYERTGVTTWKTASFPDVSGDVVFAAAASQTDVWVFVTEGNRTLVLSLVNGKWLQRGLLDGDVFQADVVDARNVTFYVPGAAYHFNGAAWSKTGDSTTAETRGYALSAADQWTFSGTKVTHIDGKRRTTWNLASLLPAKQELNGPLVVGIYATSDSNVYAIGSGEAQDAGGPTVVLHYNGHKWSKLATASVAGNLRADVDPDGSGGLWIPVSWGGGGTILHFSGGKLTATVPLDKSASFYVADVSQIPGTADALAISNTYSLPGKGEILQYS